VDTIDWLRDDVNDPSFTFRAFGRSPGVEVIIDSTAVSGTTVLSDLASAVGSIGAERVCVDATDVLGN
jgi:hypothetical protein